MPSAIYDPRALAEDLERVSLASRLSQRIRACLVLTRDREHALDVVKETVVGAGRPLYHFHVSGRRCFAAAELRWEPLGAAAGDVHALLQGALELRGGGVVVLEDCVAQLRDETGDPRARMLLARMLSAEVSSNGLVLVFLEPPEAEGRLPTILADQFVRLEVPYPRSGELERIAKEEIAFLAHRAGQALDPKLVGECGARLATGLVGLTRSAARDALHDALAPDPMDFQGAFGRLQARKVAHLQRELAMNVLDTEGAEEPMGLDRLVAWIETQRPRMRLTGPERARGVLLVGPPGTGKTMLARSIGRLVGLPVIQFLISSLMNSLLGETERRFTQAFATSEAMSPNVMFIDELEKLFGDSTDRDGGTMMRCTGALLSWLSDNPYPNFIVATANGLSRMGEIGLTLTRSERFDKIFFVDVPNRSARRAMLSRWLEDSIPDLEQHLDPLVDATYHFSGADLRSITKQAVAEATSRGTVVSVADVRAQADAIRLRAHALWESFRGLREWARLHCEWAGASDDEPGA